MKRINKELKEIADRHIEAKTKRSFSKITPTQLEEFCKLDDPKPYLLQLMKDGATFEGVLEQIETRYASVGSIVLGSFGYASNNYRKAVYDGFKKLFGGYYQG